MSATRIRSVGGTTIGPVHRATCHCGAVELELRLPHGIVDPQRCDCSLCRRRGAIVATVPLPDLRVVRGHAALRLYQFHTRTAKHYFCSVCGVYTHHQRRSDPNEYGVNVGCLQSVDPLWLDPVPVSDGVHHPSDSQPQ
ncbi:GFA family protein [Lysobacter yananisis]|uniref:GFA family protein n=1 Tax=Lysobacter yananisis TaxID=1003114 RepID=A0ABY9PAS5_9GAMM|nr:GFA family protein [Lysobacter yananisis]WMT04131.1 GFA family protein [Lysobacter yananisis]